MKQNEISLLFALRYTGKAMAIALILPCFLLTSLALKAQPGLNNQFTDATTNSPSSENDSTLIVPLLDMIKIPAGSFIMGDDYTDDSPAHTVTISKSFLISKYEITQIQWQAVTGSNPSFHTGCNDCPVEEVSWNDVHDFLNKLNQKYPGKNYRLPTEAEWEYVARGNNKAGYVYSGGNNLNDLGWFGGDGGNSGDASHPVGQKAANLFGVMDMSGNVWEWCEDWYGDYSSQTQTDPKGPLTGSDRVLRGGSWGRNPVECRVAFRANNSPTGLSSGIGFRVVCSY